MRLCPKTSMSFTIAFAIALAAASASAAKPKAEKPAPPAAAAAAKSVKQYSIEQFLDTVGMGGASFSPDEKKILFHSNKTGIWNVYTMPIDGANMTM